jgi:hypothetical protein
VAKLLYQQMRGLFLRVKMSRLFLVSFLLLLLFSYWVGDGVLYPLGAGIFLALLYLVLMGLVFFFHVVP